MIISNGSIQYKYKEVSGGGFDEDGYPLPPSNVTWSEPIPCQYLHNQYDNLGSTQGGAFTIAHYTILVEDYKEVEESEQLRLTDDKGKTLGDFSVIASEELVAVAQKRIMV